MAGGRPDRLPAGPARPDGRGAEKPGRRPTKLAAPRLIVRSEPESVEGKADQRSFNPMLGGHRGNVGVVVLDGDGRGGVGLGPAGRIEIGMQVVGDKTRLETKRVDQPACRPLEVGDRRGRVQVADRRCNRCAIAPNCAKRVLQEGPDRQHIGHRPRKRNDGGRVPPTPTPPHEGRGAMSCPFRRGGEEQ